MVIVFDADIFEKKVKNYDEIIEMGEKNNILAITNPGFELFLLLHYEKSYETDIVPHSEEIIQNMKTGNQTFIYSLLKKRTGINSKRNHKIGELAIRIMIAIEQEKKLNQDIHECRGKITSNIGKIIEGIMRNEILS